MKRKTPEKSTKETETESTSKKSRPTMKYCAFLRGINVGGRRILMKDLAKSFVNAGYKDVETFIASGNVIFTSKSPPVHSHIEEFLESEFGTIPVFVRSISELQDIIQSLDTSYPTTNIAFLKSKLTEEKRNLLMKHSSDEDQLVCRDLEYVWYSKTKMSESPLFKVSFEKLLECDLTVRNRNTLSRIIAKYAST
ncbi:hypothetical protein BC833DRAFT_571922 [Globomyces pollinis-pini]|nr:hypothetical protein BC833DRAFT_571922 [Globomyces pollinis-pini]